VKRSNGRRERVAAAEGAPVPPARYHRPDSPPWPPLIRAIAVARIAAEEPGSGGRTLLLEVGQALLQALGPKSPPLPR